MERITKKTKRLLALTACLTQAGCVNINHYSDSEVEYGQKKTNPSVIFGSNTEESKENQTIPDNNAKGSSSSNK